MVDLLYNLKADYYYLCIVVFIAVVVVTATLRCRIPPRRTGSLELNIKPGVHL